MSQFPDMLDELKFRIQTSLYNSMMELNPFGSNTEYIIFTAILLNQQVQKGKNIQFDF